MAVSRGDPAGTEIECARAPPSDQLAKRYVRPPRSKVSGAVSRARYPTAASRENGAADCTSSYASGAPDGDEESSRSLVSGRRSIVWDELLIPLSVAVRRIS